MKKNEQFCCGVCFAPKRCKFYSEKLEIFIVFKERRGLTHLRFAQFDKMTYICKGIIGETGIKGPGGCLKFRKMKQRPRGIFLSMSKVNVFFRQTAKPSCAATPSPPKSAASPEADG